MSSPARPRRPASCSTGCPWQSCCRARSRSPAAGCGCRARSARGCWTCWASPRACVTRLSPKERKELRRLLGKLDLGGLSRELSGLDQGLAQAPRTRRRAPGELPAEPSAPEGADDLDALSTEELHDRAVARAERHLDVRFFWRLLQAIPRRAGGHRRRGGGGVRRAVLQRPDQRRPQKRRGAAGRGAAAAVHRVPAQAPRLPRLARRPHPDDRQRATRPGRTRQPPAARRRPAAAARAVRDALRPGPDAPDDDRARLPRAVLRGGARARHQRQVLDHQDDGRDPRAPRAAHRRLPVAPPRLLLRAGAGRRAGDGPRRLRRRRLAGGVGGRAGQPHARRRRPRDPVRTADGGRLLAHGLGRRRGGGRRGRARGALRRHQRGRRAGDGADQRRPRAHPLAGPDGAAHRRGEARRRRRRARCWCSARTSTSRPSRWPGGWPASGAPRIVRARPPAGRAVAACPGRLPAAQLRPRPGRRRGLPRARRPARQRAGGRRRRLPRPRSRDACR